ncbi:hypothetical protein RJT34_13831 [Clitoria ternatea]|uniref:Dof-type domain-containing protein n=1 Tax=Clitoria ternatea TaxID=43366 RepID=A0AAN9JSR3_CLITE
MAELRRGEGIKLFGAMITFKGGEKEHKKAAKGNEEEKVEKRTEKIIPCPRCKSMETKFCYFNNYNVNQPRHFCKGCQRYWTAGGALRNVPVGAGRRKAKPPCRVDGDDTQFGTEQGLVLDDWHLPMPHTDFRQVFPVKRPRTASGSFLYLLL